MLLFFIIPSRDSTLSFSTPRNPSKKRYFGGFCCFLFFFQKRVHSMDIICQNLFFWQKYIICIRPGLYFHGWPLKDSLNSENLRKKRKMRNPIFDLIKGCDIPLGSQALECAWSFFSSFGKKKTEFRSKIFFSGKLRMLHIWYSSFIFSRIIRHTLVLDTYIVTYNSINVYPKLATISVPPRSR